MPSPFPGMDPFIENQGWSDFHARLITSLADALVPQARPRYTIRIEEYVRHEDRRPKKRTAIRPDAIVVARETMTAYQTATAIVTDLTLPIPEHEIETYLVVHEHGSERVVTVIEVLSPANKRAGKEGLAEYLIKRGRVLVSPAHLVELDLLRGGKRLPTIEPLPAADYYAFISRAYKRPHAQVHAWSLRAPLPTIPIPLDEDVPEMTLDLQTIFARVYDNAGYDYSLDYRRKLVPPLSETDTAWINTCLQAQPA